MSRIVTYITDTPMKAGAVNRMTASMPIMMELWRRDAPISVCRHDANTSVDYSLDAPDSIPAGACYQFETYAEKDDETGLDEYCITAQQMTIEREGGTE